MTTPEILIKISNLKNEVKSKTKEIESLKKQLKKNSEREARIIERERKKRADKMADFIKQNSSRTIIVKCIMPEYNGEEYLGEEDAEYICKPGEYTLFKSGIGNWAITKPKEFSMLLECVDNIYIAFE